MAKLTAAERKRIPTSQFAGPHRSFPVHDRAHATAALRLVGRAHNLSSAQRAHIKSRARAVLRRSP